MDPLKNSAPVGPLDPIAENRRRAAPPPGSAPGKSRAAPAPGGDNVTLSQAARLLAAAGNAPAAANGATEARLGALKKAIGNGTYGVDQKLIARSLIRDNLALLAAAPAPTPSTD